MFSIDEGSAVPPFEQLRMQIIDRVRLGQLAAGAKLPTVRELASTLHLAPNTVARAYRELEATGSLETRGRNGTFVSAHGDATARQAQSAARDYADRIRRLGVPATEALDLVRRALDG
jgi:DNA-binding transcriptional regulator YhcF (GntR family)